MSFFGGSDKKKTKKEEVKEEKFDVTTVTTGGEIDTITSKLIAHAHDKSEQVRLSIQLSLQRIGEEKPELVITSAMAFVAKKGSKLARGHRVQCLKIIVAVLEVSRDTLSEDVARQLAAFAAREMVLSREVKKDWQTPASAILVSLFVPFPEIAIEELLARFKPGVVPHYFVVKTLADMAAANGVAFTLKLQDVLSRVIPVLGAVKTEPTKWVFAAALGRFAEAVDHFISNATDDLKLQVSEDAFQNDFARSFDVIQARWLISKEAKVRYAVLESMGYMATRLSKATLDSKLAVVIPAYLNAYKREKFADHQAISQGLGAILEACEDNESAQIEFQIAPVLQGIHPLIAKPLDFANPATIKNHNEMLRCFEILARSHQDTVITFLTNRFPTKDTTAIRASLIVLKHLVNAMDAELTPRKPFILSSVSALVTETDLSIRKAMLQLIVGMANHDYLAIQGGQTLVAYICDQCAISDAVVDRFDKDNKKKGSAVTPGQIRSASNRILHVMTTKVPSTHPVLWPFLLEKVCDKKYSPAIVVILRCIADLLALKRENNEEVKINFDASPNLPSPSALLARLMVLVNVPFRSRGLGDAVIDCMETLAPIIHPSIGQYWGDSVPALKDHLDAHSEDDLNLSKWQDTLLKMFRESIAAVGPGSWLRNLADALTNQYQLYEKDDALRRVLHRYIGALMAQITLRELISAKIDIVLNTTDHTNESERQGCAQGLGLAASKHLDVVLPKLRSKLESLVVKKSGFFSFGTSEEKGADNVRTTIMLTYGYVVAYADPSLVASRLDAHVLNNMLPVMDKANKLMLKENLIKAFDLIGKAMHADRVPEECKFTFKQRDKLISGILVFLGGKKKPVKGKSSSDKKHIPTATLKVLALNALSTLCNVAPAVSPDIRKEILDVVLPSYGMPEDANDDSVNNLVFANLNTLLSTLIHMDPTIVSLTTLLQRLEYYIVSKRYTERHRSSQSYLVVLKKFVTKCVNEHARHAEHELTHLGHYIATLLPRCTDPHAEVRLTAVENIQALLYVDQLLHNPDDPKPSQDIKLITELRNRMDADTLVEQLPVVNDLAGLLSSVLSASEFPSLLTSVLSGLNDSEPMCGIGAGTFLVAFISSRPAELSDKLDVLVNGLVNAVRVIPGEVQPVTLNALRLLAKFHFQATFETLLNQTLPIAPEVVTSMQAVADSDMCQPTLELLIKVVNDTPILEEKKTPKVMVATCGLAEILSQSAVVDLLQSKDRYAAVLSTLLMRVGTAAGVDDGTSTSDAIKALTVLVQSSDEKLDSELTDQAVWESMSSGKKFDEALGQFVKVFCEHRPDLDLKVAIMKYLSSFLSPRSYFGQRAAATSVLAEFVAHSKDENEVLSQLIRLLLPRVTDSKPVIRKQALRGLGNLEAVWNQTAAAAASSILSSLTSASEDKEAEVAAEAVASLTKIARVVEELTILPMLINICYRMRPAFDRSEAEIRKAAFVLFGELTRFGADETTHFMDQVHDNVPILVCHLNDEDEDVRTACLECFRKVGNIAHEQLGKTLAESDGIDSNNYDKFAGELAGLFAEFFPSRNGGYLDACVTYFKSDWSVIRSNAAIFAAQLLAHSKPDTRQRLNLNSLVNALLGLLKESSASVRAKAAKALSLLHDL